MRALRRFFHSSAVLWAALLMLLGAMLWRVWETQDLDTGDTAAYWSGAFNWFDHGSFDEWNSMVFSPLYLIFLAWMRQAFADLFAAYIVHRILIIGGAAIVVFGLLRTVLPRAWAWLVAAWWLVLPVNSGARYEIHVFGFILVALGCWLAGAGRGAAWRGAGLAAIFACALLVRNEFALTVGLLALCCAAHEGWQWWSGRQTFVRTAANAGWLVLPTLLFFLWVLWLFSGSHYHFDQKKLKKAFRARHQVNMAQVYPFGYQQRHSDWTGDPWNDGYDLMERDFGQRMPVFGEAMRANRPAIMEHVLWNVRLIPAGLQVALLGDFYGRANPDFATPPGRSVLALAGFIALVLLWLTGLVLLWKRRFRGDRAGPTGTSEKRTRPTRFFLRGSPAQWTWIALLCCVPTSCVAIATQRPRPSYIFILSLLLMAFAGLALRLLLRRAGLKPRTLIALAVVGGIAILAGGIWRASRVTVPHSPPALAEIRRLLPYGSLFATDTAVSTTNSPWGGWGLPHWAAGRHNPKSLVVSFAEIEQRLAPGATLAAALDEKRINLLFLTGEIVDRPEIQAFRSTAAAAGWKLLACSDDPVKKWQLYSRQ